MKSFIVALILLAPLPAMAQTASGNLQSTATVPSNCTIQTLQHINFGNWSRFGVQENQWTPAQGLIKVACTKGSYNLTVDNGYKPAAWMDSGNATLPYRCIRRIWSDGGVGNFGIGYRLYHDEARTQIYENLSANTTCTNEMTFKTLVFDGTTRSIDLPIYAQLAPANSAPGSLVAGVYTGQLRFTITF